MNIADLDNPTVVSAPTAPKMNIADLKDPVVVPDKLISKGEDKVAPYGLAGVIGLSGPGSKDENPNDLVVSPRPSTQMPSPYAMPGIDALDTQGSTAALKTLGSIAGGELGGAAVRAIPAVAGAAEGASLAGRVAANAAEGAGSGAGATVGSGETSPTEIAKNAATFGALGAAGPLAAKGAESVAKAVGPLAEKASARITGRAIDDVAKGANRSFRLEIGKDTPTGKTLRTVMSEGPSRDLVKHAGDALAEENTITREIESRMKEKDAIVQRTMDRYISDGEAPMSVDGDKTVKVRNAPMSELVSDSRALPPIEREPGLIKRDGVPGVIENEPATTKAPRQSMRELTGASEPSNVIEMRRKGSLDPSEMKAKIVDKANELGRDDVGKQSSTMSIVGSLEKEIQAETKATGEDPDLFWWRKQQTKHQELSKPTSDKNIDHTTAQAAHAEVAELIGDAMVSHIDDPRYAQLNKEVSALIKLRNANASRIRNAGEAGKSPGVFGHRLGHYLQKTADAGSLIAAASGSPLALAVPLATHGLPFASRNIDRLLAKIAESKITGKPYADLASQALKLGASQSAIDNVIDKAHALQTGQRQ